MNGNYLRASAVYRAGGGETGQPTKVQILMRNSFEIELESTIIFQENPPKPYEKCLC
jgi:hypothetical protein